MIRRIVTLCVISMSWLCLPSCATKPPAEILVPTVEKFRPCPKPYGPDLDLEPWDETRHLGSRENVRTTAYDIETLVNAVRLRDAVIECYEQKIR